MRLVRTTLLLSALSLWNCGPTRPYEPSAGERARVRRAIEGEIAELIRAVAEKDIDAYTAQMPDDFLIYDEGGAVITKDQQRAYALRDWAIIVRTLHNEMTVDSIAFLARDSVHVYTDQAWERIMFRRDGVTTDTVLTTQRHRELWKERGGVWRGYAVEELGGEIFIDGERYTEGG